MISFSSSRRIFRTTNARPRPMRRRSRRKSSRSVSSRARWSRRNTERLELAREYFGKLVELQPGWRDDPRREIKKVFPADAVANRLTRDLAQLSGALGQ